MSFPGGESHTACPVGPFQPPVLTFSVPALRDQHIQKKNPSSPPQPYSGISQCSADTSAALVTSLIPSNTDTGQRLLAEVGPTVSVKWEQCFLQNHHLTNEGWWSSSCWSHYFWWGQMMCEDRVLFLSCDARWAKHQTHSKHTQTLQMIYVTGKSLNFTTRKPLRFFFFCLSLWCVFISRLQVAQSFTAHKGTSFMRKLSPY